MNKLGIAKNLISDRSLAAVPPPTTAIGRSVRFAIRTFAVSSKSWKCTGGAAARPAVKPTRGVVDPTFTNLTRRMACLAQLIKQKHGNSGPALFPVVNNFAVTILAAQFQP